MLKYTLALALILSALLPLQAAEKIEKHGENFATGGRKIAVITSKDGAQYKKELSLFLRNCGSTVVDNYFAQLIYPTVKMVKGDFANGAEGYSVKVRRGKVTIHYTSPSSARSALDYLFTTFESPEGRRMLAGIDVVNSQLKNAIPNTDQKGSVGVFARSGVVDGVSRHLTNAGIGSSIEKLPMADRRNPIVAIASDDTFRINMECMKIFNPNNSLTSKGELYSASQIKNLFSTARNNRVNLALGVDLLSPNTGFEKWAGHSLNSVEGMRIVRAMIEEMATTWGVSRICVGDSKALYASDKRYVDFLKEICRRNTVEMIML